MEFLVAPEQGLRPERIRLVGCGRYEPLVRRVYDPQRRASNRRVEIIVTESLVQDFETEEPGLTGVSLDQ
jgi:flagellar motor protein MotB